MPSRRREVRFTHIVRIGVRIRCLTSRKNTLGDKPLFCWNCRSLRTTAVDNRACYDSRMSSHVRTIHSRLNCSGAEGKGRWDRRKQVRRLRRFIVREENTRLRAPRRWPPATRHDYQSCSTSIAAPLLQPFPPNLTGAQDRNCDAAVLMPSAISGISTCSRSRSPIGHLTAAPFVNGK